MLQKQVREKHVEHGGEGAAHVVEGHSNKLEAQVVEGDHANEDKGKGQDAAGDLEVHADGGKVHEARRAAGSQQAEQFADDDGDKALVESDEERRIQAQRRAAQQILVEEDHCDRNEPV